MQLQGFLSLPRRVYYVFNECRQCESQVAAIDEPVNVCKGPQAPVGLAEVKRSDFAQAKLVFDR